MLNDSELSFLLSVDGEEVSFPLNRRQIVGPATSTVSSVDSNSVHLEQLVIHSGITNLVC